jgi:hypothetical protein
MQRQLRCKQPNKNLLPPLTWPPLAPRGVPRWFPRLGCLPQCKATPHNPAPPPHTFRDIPGPGKAQHAVSCNDPCRHPGFFVFCCNSSCQHTHPSYLAAPCPKVSPKRVPQAWPPSRVQSPVSCASHSSQSLPHSQTPGWHCQQTWACTCRTRGPPPCNSNKGNGSSNSSDNILSISDLGKQPSASQRRLVQYS